MDNVMRLPFKYKSVIHLFYYEDYSVKEIAGILQINESAVKMRLQRGRKRAYGLGRRGRLMNRNDYKSLIDRIEPDKGLEERIMKGMKQNQRQTTRMRRMGVAGVTAAVMLGLVVVASLVLNLENEPANSDIPVVQQGTGRIPADREGWSQSGNHTEDRASGGQQR